MVPPTILSFCGTSRPSKNAGLEAAPGPEVGKIWTVVLYDLHRSIKMVPGFNKKKASSQHSRAGLSNQIAFDTIRFLIKKLQKPFNLIRFSINLIQK